MNKPVKSIECRKRDLVVRIADWHRIKKAPYWDVEVYIKGVYNPEQSKSFEKKSDAAKYAGEAIAKLL